MGEVIRLDAVNYREGAKPLWRRTVWNAIIDRLPKPPSECIVLYLAGEADLDRPVMLSRGFKPDNLIAVENNKAVCKKLRSKGTLCIYGDLLSVMLKFPLDVDVVIGDFCCGLEDQLRYKIALTTTKENYRKTVFAFNFMRGRERTGREHREMYERVSKQCTLQVDAKHRGLMLHNDLFMFSLGFMSGWVELQRGLLRPKNGFIEWQESQHGKESIRGLRQHFHKNPRFFPSYYSYKSISGPVFDTVAFTNPFGSFAKDSDWFNSETFGAYQRWLSGTSDRQIAAVLAHRTMRKRGMFS